jgi:hypothetical protein
MTVSRTVYRTLQYLLTSTSNVLSAWCGETHFSEGVIVKASDLKKYGCILRYRGYIGTPVLECEVLMERTPTIRTPSTKEINRRLGRIYELAFKAYERSKSSIRDSHRKEGKDNATSQDDER